MREGKEERKKRRVVKMPAEKGDISYNFVVDGMTLSPEKHHQQQALARIKWTCTAPSQCTVRAGHMHAMHGHNNNIMGEWPYHCAR